MSDPVLLFGNPRRRKRHRKHKARRHRRTNPRHSFRAHHRRRRRRNPRSLGGLSLSPMSIVRSVIVPAGIGGLGAVAVDVGMSYATFLPDSLRTGIPGTLTKLAAAILGGYVAGKVVGKDKGRLVTLGAVTVLLAQTIRTQLASALPNVKGLGGYQDYVDYRLTSSGGGVNGLAAYMAPARLGFISPAPVISSAPSSGMGAYMSPDLMPTGMGGYDWSGSDGM